MRIDNPLPLPTGRQAVPTEGDDLKPIFRVNIEDLPSICQGEQSHAINGNHDPL
jgi:hypothetical protein